MQSPTLGTVTLKQVAEAIQARTIFANPSEYHLMIGTDSQNFDKTKVVVVIALHHVGKGGIFFYEVSHVRRINNIGQKLIYETQLSLDFTEKLIKEFDMLKEETGFDYSQHMSIGIHVDAGQNGPSKQVIPEIVGWIKSCGYDVIVKPDSWAACSIANKYSK